MFVPDPNPDLEMLPGRRFRVINNFSYHSEMLGTRIVIPKNFVTDLTSVPRFFWRIFPPIGNYAPAAVVHDYLYEMGKAGVMGGPVDREQADRVFREAMAVLGVPRWKRRSMYWAVRIGGRRAWKAYRRGEPRE